VNQSTDRGPGGTGTQTHYSIHQDLYRHGRSALQRYRDVTLGRPGLFPLLRHELFVLVFGGLPGALGQVLRRLFFPLLVGSCGRNVVWGRHMVIRHGHKIHIGDNTVLDDNVVLDAKGGSNRGIVLGDNVLLSRGAILSCKNGNISIGRDVSLGMHSLIHAVEGSDVAVGDKCVLAAFVYLIGGGSYHLERLDLPIKDQGTYARGGITVADNVWIGAKAQVLDGVSIASGVVVAAGAVLNQDVAPNVIVAGVPARVVRTREARHS